MATEPADGEGARRQFFISYSRHNEDWADWMAWELEKTGHSVNLQHWDSVAGTPYLRWIEDSIRDADHVLVLLSDAYLSSAFGQTEFRMAYQADPATAHRRVIPIRVERCEPPRGSLLAQLTYVDIFGIAGEQARSHLVAAIDAAVRGRARPVNPPVFPGGVEQGHRSSAAGGDWPTGRRGARRRPAEPAATAPARAWEGAWLALRSTAASRAGMILTGLAVTFVLVAGALVATGAVAVGTAVLPALLAGACLYVFALLAREGRGRGFSPDYAANDLADAVRAQWTAQIRRLELNRDALAVRWSAAPPDLFPDWADLVRAAHGPGRPAPDSSRWVAGPAQLTGGDNELAQAVDLVPTRRLVLLGDAGSGKTTLLIRLVVDRLAGRRHGAEVPVLMSLSTWDPERDLFAWLEERLLVAHPYLARRVGPTRRTMARELIETGKILPVLDGLDEMPEQVRPGALAAINHALLPEHPLVLSARTAAYRAACAGAADGELPSTGLDAAAGVALQPVGAADVRAYLRTVEGRRRASRWEQLLTPITADPTLPAAQALTSPLMIWLARTAYAAGSGRELNLAELLDRDRYPDRDAVEQHLLGQFVPSAYRGSDTAERAERALTFLARHLRDNCRGMPELFWWEFGRAVPVAMLRALAAMAIGLATGVTVGMCFGIGVDVLSTANADTALPAGMFAGLGSGLATGLLWLAASFLGTTSPAQTLRLRPTPARIPIMAAVGVGAGFAVNLASGPGVGILVGLVGAIFAGVRAAPVDPLTPASPQGVASRDRATFLTLALVAGSTGGITGGLGMAVASGSALETRLVVGIPGGLLIAAVAGSSAGTLGAVWGWFVIARAWLAFDRQLPLRLFRFLEDACDRGVLRRAGVAYQFRHVDIQNHLAPPGESAVTGPGWAAAKPGP